MRRQLRREFLAHLAEVGERSVEDALQSLGRRNHDPTGAALASSGSSLAVVSTLGLEEVSAAGSGFALTADAGFGSGARAVFASDVALVLISGAGAALAFAGGSSFAAG